MPRTVAVVLVASVAVGGCRTFSSLPEPPREDGGAGGDAGVGATTAFLSVRDAVVVCSKVAGCASTEVGAVVETALAIPVRASGGFAACVSWLAGRVDPTRPGLEQQQG